MENQFVAENLLHLLKDSIKKGVLQTNYNDYDLSLEDIVKFTEGVELKHLSKNDTETQLRWTKEALEMVGIDYTKRPNMIKCKKDALNNLRYDFYVELSDDEYKKVCKAYEFV